jgi:uncharacterized protein
MDESLIKKYILSLSSERLKLTILPTEKCNFRCTYCWEDYQKGTMSQETVDAIKCLLNNRIKKLKILNLNWFGGEPLLEEDIVLDISDHIQQLISNYPNLIFTGGMTTNGYFLNDVTLKKLCKVGIKNYNIGLDGIAEFHNETRKLANNKETFDIIWNNLITAKKSSLDYSITLNINFFSDNYKHAIFPLLELIDNTLLEDSRFLLYFKAIRRLGGKNDEKIKHVAIEEEISIINRLKKQIKNIQQVINFNPSDYVCYASETNTMVIRANGDINKCIVALNSPYNNVGHLNSDGTVSIDRKKFLEWSKGFEPLNTSFLSCPNNFLKKIYER